MTKPLSFDPVIIAKAEKLAAMDWYTEVFEDELTNGEKCWLAKNPDLSGCMAQGATEIEAIEELASARVDYLYFLILDGHTDHLPLLKERLREIKE